VVLYQFLTGRQPFEGGGMFVVQRRILQEEAPPPSQVFAGLPSSLDAIVARALAKRPEDRFETAAVFAQDLRRVAADYLPSPPLPVAPGAPVAGTSPPVDVNLDMPPAASPAPQSWVAPPAPTPPQAQRAATATWPWWLGAAVLVAAGLAWWLMRAPDAARLPPASAAAPDLQREAASAPSLTVAPVAVPAMVPAAVPVVVAPSATAVTQAPDLAPSAAAEPVRPRPTPPPAQRPAPAPKAERPAPTYPTSPPATQPGGAMRCADILERMQLGEPLTAEQNNFFQSRCAR